MTEGVEDAVRPFDPVKAREKLEQARACLRDLCYGRRRWEMHVPAEEDDPDLVLGGALSALYQALAEVERLRSRGEG